VDVIRLAELRHEPLSVDEVLRAVSHPEAGGVAIFTGVVRNHDRGNGVTRLTYTAHPSAPAELRRVAEKIAAEHDVRGVAAVHRLGRLGIGELAVVVAVASPHRGGAFTACRALIDELKASVPIWKHQELTAGGSEWVNSEWADPGQPGGSAGQPAASAGQRGASAEEPPARA
jgi:molybdopterin synthase catalytic subunit